jgi:hypothetical protein
MRAQSEEEEFDRQKITQKLKRDIGAICNCILQVEAKEHEIAKKRAEVWREFDMLHPQTEETNRRAESEGEETETEENKGAKKQ